MRKIKWIFVYCFLIGIVACFILNVQAQSDSNPVRIGLIHRHNPQISFLVDAKNGLSFALMRQEEYAAPNERYIFYNHRSPDSVIVARDTAMTTQGDAWVLDSQKPQHENWYLEMPTKSDFEMDENTTLPVKVNGVNVVPYFDGDWKALIGPFHHVEEARYQQAEYQKKFPNTQFNIIEPEVSRLWVLNEDEQPLFLFGINNFEVAIQSTDDEYLRFNQNDQRLYRGFFTTYVLQNGELILVNILPMEEYLYGVVPYEIGSSSPLEAIKAQAVAARNYTVNSMGKYKSERFDLCDTVYSQVYKGIFGETENSNKGVDETRGKLLTYKGVAAQVFYFSNTGGMATENVRNVWGSEIPYLVSVESPYESEAAYNYQWRVEKTSEEVQAALERRGIQLGDVTAIQVTKRTEAGRVSEIEIIGTKGKKNLEREATRTTFGLASQHYAVQGADVLQMTNGKSTKEVVPGAISVLSSKGLKKLSNENVVFNGREKVQKNLIPNTFVFEGKGWGHAIGLSQTGAIGMAKKGYTFDKILMHYFPGTAVKDIS